MSSETSKWRLHVVTAGTIFIAWTITSFLCHECAKMFLQNAHFDMASSLGSKQSQLEPFYQFCSALILTTIQCVTCVLCVHVETDERYVINSRTMSLLLVFHALATLATNYSMIFIEAASTLAIKLTEPITMAIAQNVIFQTAVPVQTAISIPIIICGAFIFTGYNINQASDSSGISLAFVSNIILAARNITLKKLHDGSAATPTIVLKPKRHIATILLVEVVYLSLLIFLELQGIVSRNTLLLTVLVLSSGIFHVAYSYISTSIVLKVMNVVSHSIANIFKRFLVVLLLSLLGNRHISGSNFLGLVMSAFGLLIYTQGKTRLGVQQGMENLFEHTKRKLFRWKLCLSILSLATASLTTVMIFRGSVLFEPFSGPISYNYDYNAFRESRGLLEVEVRSIQFQHIKEAETDPKMREFLSWRLIEHPEDTDMRMHTLTRNKDVVEEAQRILVNLLQDLLGKAKHVMLIEIATYENKGDPAIAVGEVLLLRRMNISIVFYCGTSTCSKNSSLDKALKINQQYPEDELVILMQGGGNLVGYIDKDIIRKKYINIFPDRRIIILSQSVWLNSKSAAHLVLCRSIYSNHSNVIMFIRDRNSLEIVKDNFKGLKFMLAPDMAFGIGMVPRQMPPMYDIVWLRRTDGESSKYTLPTFPNHLTVKVSDWFVWKSNVGNTSMETAFQIASVGFQFLQRGRIVVTDRLHGHIMSTLMNIPHVLIDNPPHLKLSSFHRSWTQSLSNTILVNNGTQALDAAIVLLKRYHDYLPSIGPNDM